MLDNPVSQEYGVKRKVRELSSAAANPHRSAELTALRNPVLAGLSGRLAEIQADIMAAHNARTEAKLRTLLGQWVSELTPAMALGPDGEILGLCDADAPLGSKPFIFTGR